MAQSDARFGYEAKLSRTDHDLARPFGFTCSPGMMLPIHADKVGAGDFVKVKHILPFLRTQPLAAPAMVDVKIHFETFFVPMQMIYQPYENTQYSLKNIQSSMFNSASLLNEKFPLLNYSAFVTLLKSSTYYNKQERADAFRLADMLGLGAINFCAPVGQRKDQWRAYAPNFFPWQLLAYHTIWQYYFRLDDKSQFSSQHSNWDNNYATQTVTVTDPGLFKVHSRPWNFDYFTSMYRSPIVSNANLQQLLPSGSYSDILSSSGVKGIDGTGSYNNQNETVRAFSGNLGSAYAQNNTQMNVSTAAIRQLFANEKLAMITGRTRKNYDSQVLAHLGVHVPTDVKHDLQLIGKDVYTLRIGEVTSLASTDDAPLGELAGKGWATSENGEPHHAHNFRAPVDGVVMTLFSIEPLKRYYGGFERQNAVVDAFDFPVPEFDRLGNVPMYYYETGGNNANINNTDIIGWKERYYQWKRRSPKCTWAFAHSINDVNSWSTYMLSNQPFADQLVHEFTSLGQIITQYGAYQSTPSLEDRFYIPFNAMDDLMLEPFVFGWDRSIHPDGEEPSHDYLGFDDNPHLVYQRDPFIVDCYPTVTKVSWMSKDGEPVYDL